MSFTSFDIIISFLIRVTQCIYHIQLNIKLFFFCTEIIIKSLIEISILVLTFAVWLPTESAVNGFKGEQLP